MEEGNCVDSFQVNIDVISEPPTLMVSEDVLICIGESTELQVVESSSIGVYTWEPVDEEGEIISVSPTESTQYIITGDYGCFEVTDTVNVLVGQGFNILDIISSPGVDSIFEGDQVNLLATMDPEIGNYVFNWAGEGLVLDNAIGAALVAPSVEDNNTPFTYTLVVEDEYGCQNTFEITIFVDNSQVAVPTVFIPGSPIEENAVFNIITNEGTDIIEFEVFNRWGERVYSRAEDVNGDGWDGNVNGNPAPMDVYAYYALVEFNDGTQRELRGEITLIR
jgi:gliding motility-associated-like protein